MLERKKKTAPECLNCISFKNIKDIRPTNSNCPESFTTPVSILENKCVPILC